MRDLEDAARPILTPLVQGSPSTLAVADQLTVSIWGAKTAMMLQHTHPDTPANRPVPARHFQEVFLHRRPPERTQVWLGAYQYGGRLVCSASTQRMHSIKIDGISGPPDVIGFGTTLNIGHLVIQLFGHTMDAVDIEIEHGPVAPYLLQVWPATVSQTWPPAAIMNDSDLEIVKRAWGGLTTS